MKIFFAVIGLAVLSSCAIKPVTRDRDGLFDRLNEGSTGRRIESVKIGKMPYRKPTDDLKKPLLRWPLAAVEVTSSYGQRGDGFHEGVDLRAPTGTPVYAAQDGLVLHSGGQIRGYGKMVVVRHDNGWATVYAHNSKLLVKQGQRVRKGQRIANSGKTGHASGPHLHFEVRNGTSAYDPMEIMGKPVVAQVVSPGRSIRKVAQNQRIPTQKFTKKSRRAQSSKK